MMSGKEAPNVEGTYVKKIACPILGDRKLDVPSLETVSVFYETWSISKFPLYGTFSFNLTSYFSIAVGTCLRGYNIPTDGSSV
jgi:hypothetical protein